MKTLDEQIESLRKCKFYEFTYEYRRYNPQLGSYDSTSTVIARNEREATKIATLKCDGAIYGHNHFSRIISKNRQMIVDKDFRFEKREVMNSKGRWVKQIEYAKIY